MVFFSQMSIYLLICTTSYDTVDKIFGIHSLHKAKVAVIILKLGEDGSIATEPSSPMQDKWATELWVQESSPQTDRGSRNFKGPAVVF